MVTRVRVRVRVRVRAWVNGKARNCFFHLVLPLLLPLSFGLSIGVICFSFLVNQICLHLLGFKWYWTVLSMDGETSTVLFCMGLNSPDELIDLTDGEVKEVLLEPLQLAGASALHIARILKALEQHRSSTVTNNVDDLVNPVVTADPAITTNRVDNLETIEMSEFYVPV
jgi:hypothetical protein